MINKSLLVRRILFSVTIGILILLLIVFVRWGIGLFQVKHITLMGDPVDLQINESLFVNNTLFFPSQTVIQNLKENYPLIKTIEIRKRYPSTLEFVIYKRIPIATLVIQGVFYGIDSEGVITDLYIKDVPVIISDIPPVRIGAKIKAQMILESVQLISKTAGIFTWSRFEPYETQSIRAQLGKTDIFITQNSDLSQVVDTLQTLMEGFRIKGTIPKSIDLRFGKPIVQL